MFESEDNVTFEAVNEKMIELLQLRGKKNSSHSEQRKKLRKLAEVENFRELFSHFAQSTSDLRQEQPWRWHCCQDSAIRHRLAL